MAGDGRPAVHSERQLLALTEASRRIYAATDLEVALEIAAHEARALIGAHQAVVALTGPGGEQLIRAVSLSDQSAAGIARSGDLAGQRMHPSFDDLAGPVRLGPEDADALLEGAGFCTVAGRPLPIKGLLVAPLLGRKGDRVGLFALSDPFASLFAATDEAVLMQLAHTAAFVIQNVRLLQEAQAGEARLRRFLDSSLDIVCTISASGRFEEVSGNCRQILGYTPQELIGRPYMQFVHPEDRARTEVEAAAILADNPSRGFANRYLGKDGRIVHLHWSAVWSQSDRTFYCVVRDLTERVKLESQLARVQRLEAVGNLTGGVAHDFNNLLTIILGSAEGLVQGLRDDASMQELALLVQAAGERGAELTSRLLAFARRQPLAPKAVDTIAMLQAMEPLLRRTLDDDIELTIAGRARRWACQADPVQLESALLNLCINARDAMPGGGKLLIETSEVTLDATYAAASEDVAPGDYVLIAVTDSGEGMSSDTLGRVFEPFFTTKPLGHGSGLGLSMVYGFIKQSGGHIRIYSELDFGTTVKLYLPRAASGEARPVAAAEALTPRGAEHVLVVEDDNLVRSHVSKLLAGLGYRVTVASEGASALRLLAKITDIDLLFTDVVMPGMNGSQLAEHARKLRPDLKVLFTSGYSEQAIIHKGRLDAGVLLLNKPYRKQDLAIKVREALERR